MIEDPKKLKVCNICNHRVYMHTDSVLIPRTWWCIMCKCKFIDCSHIRVELLGVIFDENS